MSKKVSNFEIVLGVLAIVIIVVLCAGWVLNVVELAAMSDITPLTVVRALGVAIPPLGGVLGWI